MPGAVVGWWRSHGLPVSRLEDPRWLGLWSEQSPSDALWSALGAPGRAVVVGQLQVARALARRGVQVRQVGIDPPPGQHQAAWLAGRSLDPDRVPPALAPGRGLAKAFDVLLFPGSGGRAKCWGADRYAALGRALVSTGQTVAVVLGPVEQARGPGPEAFAGLRVVTTPGLVETAALCASAGQVVGNDAGTSHLAAAAGARGLVLFGPTDPARWRPLGGGLRVLQAPLETLAVATVLAALAVG